MTRKTLITFVSVFMAASLPMTSAAQAGKKTAIGLGIVAGAVILGAAANASRNNQRKAQARARAKAKARARARAKAAAKKRAYAAQKKKAAQKRAYAAAKKKKAAQQRAYAAAKKKKAAQQRAYAAKKAKQQKIAATEAHARSEAEAQAKADAEKTEGAFVDAPSTAALLTSQDVAEDTNEVMATGDATEVAIANDTDVETTPVVENSDSVEGNCKRFIPAVGLTVSVGC